MKEELATKEEVSQAWEILRSSGAYLEGHFYLPSTGLHYNDFFQIPLALQYSNNARVLCIALARILRRSGILHSLQKGKRFTLAAPMDAGIPVAFWVGENLDADRILWVSRYGEDWSLRPFIEIDGKDQVLLVDDTILTGGTMGSVVDFVRRKGASIIAIAAIVDRRARKGDFNGIPIYSLLSVKSLRYKPKNCPMCKARKKVTEIRLR